MKNKLLVWFLKSTHMRQVVTGLVGAGASWLVSKGVPAEFQEQIITVGTASVMLVTNIGAELMLKSGNAKLQTELNKTMASGSEVEVDGVITEGGETLETTKAVVRAAPDNIPAPKPRGGQRKRPRGMMGGRMQ